MDDLSMYYGMVRRPTMLDAAPMYPYAQQPMGPTPIGGIARRRAQPVAAYNGSLGQQYDQALGTQPRYISPNLGNQRLNHMYDQAFGYTT